MFSRRLCVSLAAICLAGTAGAQISSSGLGEVDGWGAGYLGSGERGFDNDIWKGSDADLLLPVFRSIEVAKLSPGERAILRRLLLSSADSPPGDAADELLGERARLVFELGETRAAMALLPQVNVPSGEMKPDQLAVDLELLSGEEQRVCARPLSKEDFASAELLVELAAQAGVSDPWFTQAVFAATGDLPEPPEARFDSGLNIFLSGLGGLEATVEAVPEDRPDIAAVIAQIGALSPEVRVKAADVATAAGLLPASVQRAAYEDLLAQEEYEPTGALEIALAAMFAPDEVEEPETLMVILPGANGEQTVTLKNPEAAKPKGPPQNEDRARKLFAALAAVSGEPGRYDATARLLAEDLGRIDQTLESAPFALAFARAALAADDRRLMMSWLNAAEVEGTDEPDPFALAAVQALDVITDGDRSRSSQRSIGGRLIENARTDAEKKMAAQILTTWFAAGLPMPIEARKLILSRRDGSSGIDPFRLMAIEAAARNGAEGEAVMMLLGETRGSPARLSGADLSTLLMVLENAGAKDLASDLALEAVGFRTPAN